MDTVHATRPPTEPALPLPEKIPFTFAGDDATLSVCTIHPDCGMGVTVWSLPEASRTSKTDLDVRLELSPERPVIIGRAEGGEIEYLDPKYVPTRIVPTTGKTVLRHDGSDKDIYVSRGHFLMRSHAGGVMLVNGVPRRGGGIRPPMNGTYLMAPQTRWLEPGEDYLIVRGSAATIRLPNGTQLTLLAE
jgi:hypothetical protein